MTTSDRTRLLLAACVVLAAAFFVADIGFPLGISAGLPYVVLVLLGVWLPWRRATLVLAAAATILVVIGYYFSEPLGPPWVVATNRALALGAIWVVGVLGYLQQSALQRARDTARRLRVAMDSAIDAIIVIDGSGIIEMVNPACEELFGYKARELVGRNVSMLMASPDRERHDDYLKRYLETGEKRIIGIVGREVTAVRKDGTLFPVQLAVGETELSGKPMFTGFIHDLTERKQAQQQVQELRSEVQRASRLAELGEMAGVIAHELNQPLTAVGNYIEAARQQLSRSGVDVPEKVEELMGKAITQTARASDVIRNIRKMAGKGDAEKSAEDINEVVREAADLALIDADRRGIRVSLDMADGLPPCEVNRTQIQQVVLNLVRNGIEAMDGCETRELAIRTAPGGDGTVELSVADTGAGLPEEMHDNLFQPFRTTKADGLGLGLSISKSIVDEHGGEIRAGPNGGGGTVFRISLPAAVAAGGAGG